MRVNLVRRGSGDPLVLTHGIGSSAATFGAVARPLSERFETLAWDLPGHGESPQPTTTAACARDRVLLDLDDVIATSQAATPPVLVGHSLGGYLTLAWAITRPAEARALVVLGTGPGFRDPAKRDAWNERARRLATRLDVPDVAGELNLQHDSLVIDRLDEIRVPVLLIVGDADNPQLVGGMRYLDAKLPNAHLEVLEGGEHNMHESTHAERVAELIADFAA